MSDQITDRLKSALSQEQEPTVSVAELPVIIEEKPGSTVMTTPEELEGFYIVRAILRTKIEPARIVHRDAQSYFAILLDDNNRKPICRLYFNGPKKYMALLDETKKETRHEITSLNDIFNYADNLLKAVGAYEATDKKDA